MKNQRLLFLLLVSTFTVSCSHTSPKRIIGAIETVQVQDLEYLARIDTGADTTSINAYNITVDGEDPNLTANIGKQLRFTSANENGESQTIETKIVKVNTVRNVLGSESRYVVRLAIAWEKYVKIVEVNLRDRSKMQFALLIGRNWLKNDFVVDVSDEQQRLQEENNLIQRLLPRILTQ
jgi:hypothetical protein